MTRTPQIPDALMSLRPNAQWVLRGDAYSGLEWNDQVQTCPTQEEIDAEISRLSSVWTLTTCEKRAKELIAEVDWAMLPDVNLSNKSDFESYRSQLRAYIIEPIADPTWPVKPDPVWGQ